MCTYRHDPPVFASNLSIRIFSCLGLSHLITIFGSVNALNTRSRGASNSLTVMISFLPGSTVNCVLFFIRLIVIGYWLLVIGYWLLDIGYWILVIFFSS